MNTIAATGSGRLRLPLIAFSAAAFLLAYYPVLRGLVRVWSESEDSSHGFLIVPIVAYVIWHRREELQRIPVVSSTLGAFVTASGLLLYVLATYAGIATVASVSIVPVIGGAVLYIFGRRMFRTLLFPLFLLVFMIPVPAQMYSAATLPLQLIVTRAATHIVSLIGVPVFSEGNVIHLPEQTLQVVQACSGLRSMMAMLMLSALIGYFTLRSNALRSVLFAAAIPVSIGINVVRVLTMIIAYYYLRFDLAVEPHHTILGMSMFVLGIVFFVVLKGVMARWDR